MAVKFKKGIDLQGQRAVSAADASAATDLVTLQQLQAFVRGADWKENVLAASTTNVSLTAPGGTMDGVTLTTGCRILLKNQTTGSQNGIYIWSGASTALTRSIDADSSDEVTAGMAVTVLQGTTNRVNGTPTAWVLTTNDPITLGTTALAFTVLGGGAAPYTAGDGLQLSGQAFSVKVGNGLIVDANGVRVDPSIVNRRYAADCVATTNPQSFTHGFGSDVQVQVFEGGELVYPDITKTATTVSIDWGSAPSAGQYRVVVHG